jgi:predicted GNAT family acetyltransferase
MRHLLDRPVWSALTSRHAGLAEGGNLARRYPASITGFADTPDDSRESLHALEDLVGPGEGQILLRADEIVLPPGLVATMTASGVQMIADGPLPKVADERIERLTQADAVEMLALATLTKPGPFSLRAQCLGAFWGVRIEGRLAAMAGERMKQDGYTEVSGVCTHPDFRGRGLARLLSAFVAGHLSDRGEVPYLHAFATNAPAIALYEGLGFALRCMMHVAFVERRG